MDPNQAMERASHPKPGVLSDFILGSQDGIREILASWGYKDADLEEIVERICRNPTAELEFMMSFELKLSPVETGAPRASAFLVGTATVVGHFIPLSPFFFVGSDVLLGAVLAVLLSGAALFGIGWYEAKITVGSWWREALEMLVIGRGGGCAG